MAANHVEHAGSEADGTRPAISAEQIAAAWERELPGASTGSILVITPIWRVAKLLSDERRRTLHAAGVDAATLDLLSTLRRAGEPYTLTTRQIGEQALITAGAVTQRVDRAEREGLVTKSPSGASRKAVAVTLTPAGHTLIERTVQGLLAHEETLLSALDARTRAGLVEGLAALERSLRAPDASGALGAG